MSERPYVSFDHEQPRSKVVSVRLTPAEYDKAKDTAAQLEISVPALLREALRLKVNRHNSAFVSQHPAIHSGAPCLNRTRLTVQTVAGLVAAEEGVDVVAEEYDIRREDVLVACWWMGTWGPRSWRRDWGAWAEAAHAELWHGRYETIPDPPRRPQ